MNTADMICDLSACWAAVKEEFPYFGRLTFDWDGQYRAYLEKLLDVRGEAEFHALMTAFMDSLGDGHTKYIPPERFRDDKPFVPPDAPSFTYGEGVLTVRLNDFLSDRSGYVKDLLEKYPDASLVRLDIRENIGGNTYYAANVAKLFIPGVFSGCQKWTQVRRAVDAAGASQLMRIGEERLKQYLRDGLVREDEKEDARLVMGRMKYETYTDTCGSEGDKALYTGPMELLISKNTMSAAEDFTAMFKSSGRAVLVGEPTYGSTGTPYMISLRCGGRAQVVSVGYRLLDGTEFIGKGIMPDVPGENGASKEG